MKLMRFTQKQNQLRYQTFLSFCTRTDIDNKGAVYHSREIIWEILIAKKDTRAREVFTTKLKVARKFLAQEMLVHS